LLGNGAGSGESGSMNTMTVTPAPSRTVRIVTVDDQPYFREAARTIIARVAGFEVVGETASGDEALDLSRELDPDMVLVDVRMGGLDGIETARRLMAEDPTRVVVLVSSADVRELSLLAESCGAAAILRKHWLTPLLMRGLWAALRRR
jgi:DNA-binding NarL/FixJ family response regulator